MPELLVVVLELAGDGVRAVLGEVDRPGSVLREAATRRSPDLLADAATVLGRLDAADLAPVLLAVAVAVGPDVEPPDAAPLRRALGLELPDGWGLPFPLPVVWGSAQAWAAQAAAAPSRPVVAGAVVAAARSVGAHAHLPEERPADR